MRKIYGMILVSILLLTVTACGKNSQMFYGSDSAQKNGNSTTSSVKSGMETPPGVPTQNPAVTPSDGTLQLESTAPQSDTETVESVDNLYKTLDDLDKLMDSLNDISDDNLVIPEPTG